MFYGLNLKKTFGLPFKKKIARKCRRSYLNENQTKLTTDCHTHTAVAAAVGSQLASNC